MEKARIDKLKGQEIICFGFWMDAEHDYELDPNEETQRRAERWARFYMLACRETDKELCKDSQRRAQERRNI